MQEPLFGCNHDWEWLEIDWGFYCWVCIKCGDKSFDDPNA